MIQGVPYLGEQERRGRGLGARHDEYGKEACLKLLQALHRYPALESLRHEAFRRYWMSRLWGTAAFQMGTVVQGWLVYQMTGSGFALGWVGAGQTVAMVGFSLYGGAVSDRVERRKVMIWSRATMAANALILALLAVSGALQVWHLFLSALVLGLSNAFMLPAQKALVADLVDRKMLLNAFSLNTLAEGLVAIVAASLAGFIIEVVGAEGVFLAMFALQVLSVVIVAKLPRLVIPAVAAQSAWRDLRQGLAYIRASSPLMVLLVITLIRGMLIMPFRTLLPQYAEDLLHFDAAGLGLLSAAPGVGALLSALALASVGSRGNMGRALVYGGIATGITLALFAALPYVPMAFLFLFLVGGASNVCLATNQALLQEKSEERYRGRVMAVYMSVLSTTALGAMPLGLIADRWGISASLALEGVLVALAFGLVLVLRRELVRPEAEVG